MWLTASGQHINIQTFVDAIEDSQGVTVFDEIWDAMNSELVVQIFDLGVPVEDAVAETCAFIESQLPTE